MLSDATGPARILVVEDDPAQTRMITEALTSCQPSWQVETTATAAQFRAQLAGAAYDAAIIDYVLPDEDGLALLKSVRERLPEATIVLMTAFGGEEVAAEALRAGADDYVAKTGSWMRVLAASMERCLAARARAHEYQAKLRTCETILDHAADLGFSIAPDGTLEFVSGPVGRLLGYAPEEVVGAAPGTRLLGKEQVPLLREALQRLVESRQGTEHLELRLRARDGTDMWVRASLSPSLDEEGKVIGIVGTAQDVTEELATARELERRNQELACLQSVTSALHGSLDVRAATQAALTALTEHPLADTAGVFFLREDGEEVDYPLHAGVPEEVVSAYSERLHRVGESLAGLPMATGETHIFGPDDMASQALHPDVMLAHELDNGLAVPVVLDGETIGSLTVCRSGKPYEERDGELLRSIAAQIAVAAETARMHGRVMSALSGASRLLDVSLAINAHRDLDEILRSVALSAVEVADGISASVLLLAEDGDEFERRFAVAADGSDISEARVPRADGIAYATVRAGHELFVTSESEGPPYLRSPDLERGVRSVVALPLATAGEARGVLLVHRAGTEPLVPVRVRTLEMLAAQAAQAVDNTRLLQRAQHSEALYRELFEHSGLPTVVFEPGGMIKMVNAHFQEALGYSREELVGKASVFDLIDARDTDGMRAVHEARVAGEQPFSPLHSFRAVRKDGQVRWLQAALHLMPDGETVTAVVVDTTEAHHLQRQVIQAEKAAALGQLVSGVAHELNNPLTAILGYAQLLQAHGDRGIRDQAGAIEQEAKRSQKIIEGLLSFARERPAKMTATDVNAVLDRALQMPAYRMKVDNIRVHTQYDDSIPLIDADPHQLQQVFLNIINNAHYAMRGLPQGGDLFVGSENLGDMARVVIRDTGPGMKDEDASRAFDPFFTTKDVHEGTGLGLSVSQGIVEQHGGRIELDTAEGEGATLTIHLPIRPPQEPEEAEGTERVDEVLITGRVLVVDDEETLLNLVRQVLEIEGHQVDTVLAVVAAMSLLEVNDYDVILSDLRMPGLDGEDLLRHITRARPELLPRFVVVTGDTGAPETLELLDRPDLRSLAKPFGIQDLCHTVADVIKSGRGG